MTTKNLHYSIVITQSPHNDENNETAAAFAAAVLDSGHTIDRIFFYQDAVFTALKDITSPQGQLPHSHHWEALKSSHNIPLQVCIANALRRGVYDATEANRYDTVFNLHKDFELTGLGEIAETLSQSDRIITF